MTMISAVLVFAIAAALVAVRDAALGKFRKKETAQSFECPFESGVFANPVNCRKFYICNGFVPFDFPCPNPLYFDDATKVCVRKTKDYVCGPVAVTTQAPTTPDPEASPPCFPPGCKLPDCFCSSDGTQIPGNLLLKETPQMIIIAFSGALNVLNAEPFGYLLNDTRTNPNGCPIKATFFVPHEYTSYYYVQKLYGQGHEIAAQTITNRQPEDYWPTASRDDWIEEVIGMKEILHTFANISREDILGVRAPYMKSGGNNMLSMIYDYGLDYDSSLAAPSSEVPLWPYTLDYRIPHSCLSGNCPSRSFPGIWEFPLNAMYTEDGIGGTCTLLDQCIFPDDAESIFDFLYHNFERHYTTNKAPFQLNLQVNWVTDDSKISALDVFIDHILENYPDAWFVTMSQALDWMRNPVPSTVAQSFESWKCPRTRQPGCNIPRTCAVQRADARDIRYIQLCGNCPERYPWLNNIRGTKAGKKIKDLVQKET